jgi:hypothetical protein
VETLRRDFVAGLLVFVPVGFTILGVLWILRQLDNLVLPQVFRALGLEGRQPPLVGVIATLALILLFGALTRSFVGRTFIRLWERTVKRIPIARSLYTVLKQFMEAVFGTKGSTGNRPRHFAQRRAPRRAAAGVRAEHAQPDDGLLPAGARTGRDRDRPRRRGGVPADHLGRDRERGGQGRARAAGLAGRRGRRRG